MRPELLDILSRKQVGIDNETLEKYLSGQLNDEARHQVEKILQDGDTLEEEAWDGWQNASNPANLINHAEDINRRLLQQLHPANAKRKRRAIKEFPLSWWVYGLVIILALIAWGIIHFLSK
jgi:anti-sigma factor RsiW